jgi:hypothetical protein
LFREGEALAEPKGWGESRLGGSLGVKEGGASRTVRSQAGAWERGTTGGTLQPSYVIMRGLRISKSYDKIDL